MGLWKVRKMLPNCALNRALVMHLGRETGHTSMRREKAGAGTLSWPRVCSPQLLPLLHPSSQHLSRLCILIGLGEHNMGRWGKHKHDLGGAAPTPIYHPPSPLVVPTCMRSSSPVSACCQVSECMYCSVLMMRISRSSSGMMAPVRQPCRSMRS